MKLSFGGRNPQHIKRRRSTGASTAEYVAVMLGLMLAWRATDDVLRLVREHHLEFTWALTIPF